MKIILVFVSTLDGKVTKWDDPDVRKWTSESDQNYFKKLWKDSNLIVMGINTFMATPPKASAKHHFHIMTHKPTEYKSYEVPGRIEFSDESPGQLVSRFENEGFRQMLVVGGPKISASFLREQLADELWLTIEPRIFGKGANLGADERLNINLRLISCQKVNEQGTLITKYSILRNLKLNQD
jgi:dihydrofolate reductase